MRRGTKSCARRAASPARRRGGGARPGGAPGRAYARRAARHRGDPRSRPRHPHQRGDPSQQLPALAIRLRRVRLHGRPVARLRQGRVPPGAGGVLPPPPALRADRRAGRTAPPEVAMLLQRIATAVVLIPLLVASILSSGGRPGGWPFLLLCGVAAALCAAERFRRFFRGARDRAGGVALVLLVFLSVSLSPGFFGVPALLVCVLLAVFHALPGSADPA